jgi:hypothetical protein
VYDKTARLEDQRTGRLRAAVTLCGPRVRPTLYQYELSIPTQCAGGNDLLDAPARCAVSACPRRLLAPGATAPLGFACTPWACRRGMAASNDGILPRYQPLRHARVIFGVVSGGHLVDQ